ncbi:unnamed protein product [Boreogadus saida]
MWRKTHKSPDNIPPSGLLIGHAPRWVPGGGLQEMFQHAYQTDRRDGCTGLVLKGRDYAALKPERCSGQPVKVDRGFLHTGVRASASALGSPSEVHQKAPTRGTSGELEGEEDGVSG